MDIEHVALNVIDPPAMARWYVEHLQMKVVRRLDEAPFTHFGMARTRVSRVEEALGDGDKTELPGRWPF